MLCLKVHGQLSIPGASSSAGHTALMAGEEGRRGGCYRATGVRIYI